jgi:hypothetical protein
MHSIQLDDEELRLVRAALQSHLESFSHHGAEILRAAKAILAPLPAPAS